MKKIPDAELELMMVIWDSEQPVSRMEIEMKLGNGRDVVPSTLLSLLSRLEKRGFVRKEKQGNINYYNALVEKSAYLQEEGQRVLDKMFGSSLKNFVTALYDGKGLNREEIAELQAFIDEQTAEQKGR
ncbi:MAG: BlaI/MecI/CopY family transcriptional regulator [Lachnospiraceae bacterium]|jgi:predicted transcriptional regulator